jgi:hypothetical protein
MAVNFKMFNSSDLVVDSSLLDNDEALLQGDRPVLGLSNGSSTGQFKHPKGNGGIKHKHYEILALHLSGRTAQEISKLVGYSPVSIYNILKREDIIVLRQQILDGIGDEFEVLFADVVNTIRELLNSSKEAIRLEACEKWLKAHNKFGKEKNTINVTAEDVVFQILNQKS